MCTKTNKSSIKELLSKAILIALALFFLNGCGKDSKQETVLDEDIEIFQKRKKCCILILR